jgi:hypothetical protein
LGVDGTKSATAIRISLLYWLVLRHGEQLDRVVSRPESEEVARPRVVLLPNRKGTAWPAHFVQVVNWGLEYI